MSSCLSGGGRTYGFELDIVKSASTSAQTLHTTTSSSSPSSTLSESSNSPLTISTRKPRTPRKRPNQVYNEAAALLSTAYPSIFSPKHLTKNPSKFTKKNEPFYDESSVLLLPFRVIDDFGVPLPLVQEKTNFHSIASPIEIDSHMNSNSNSLSFCDGYLQDNDFDAESILEEEIEEGIIDSIMGNLSVNNNNNNNSVDEYSNVNIVNSCYGCPMPWQMGLGNFGYGIKWGLRGALRPVDDSDWWRFPAVDVGQISPRISITNIKSSNSEVKKTKKKKKVEKIAHEQEVNEASNLIKSELSEETKFIQTNAGSGLLLKLNFDSVLNAWSGRGSPFSEEIQELAGENDVHARLAQIDLGLENGGVREASVLRYKEKRRTRLFSKKIRYQVRKVNADRRPRMKGRFVRRPNSNGRVVI